MASNSSSRATAVIKDGRRSLNGARFISMNAIGTAGIGGSELGKRVEDVVGRSSDQFIAAIAL